MGYCAADSAHEAVVYNTLYARGETLSEQKSHAFFWKALGLTKEEYKPLADEALASVRAKWSNNVLGPYRHAATKQNRNPMTWKSDYVVEKADNSLVFYDIRGGYFHLTPKVMFVDEVKEFIAKQLGITYVVIWDDKKNTETI